MATSTRNFALALIAAVCLHGLLLVQKLSFKEIAQNKETRLKVIMLTQDVNQPESDLGLLAEKTEENVTQESAKASTAATKLNQIIVVNRSIDSDSNTISIQTSPQSNSFKRWLKSETDSFIRQNPDSIANFDTTFDESKPYQAPKELAPGNPKSIPRGSTTFVTQQKGKRTCMVKNLNLLDITAGPNFVAKDCTPEKKFTLNLN